MVQPPQVALFVAVVGILVAVVTLAPLQLQHHRQRINYHHQFDLVLPVEHGANAFKFGDAEDGTARSERSTNLSHITGTSRKIQMYVKNKHLQILPDGTINGTADDGSDYTIFQRTSVNNGQLKIQGVASCLFLCMDSCGLLYGSREFTEDCVFNEMIEQHHYNTYSSARYSNKKRTLYLALNNRGQPRKVQLRGPKTLGKLSTYARVLTQQVPAERVDDLVRRILHARDAATGGRPTPNPLRHHGYHLLCPQIVGHELAEDADGARDKFRCRTRRKRKKKKRRCEDGEEEGDCEMDTDEESVDTRNECEDGDEDECQKKLVTTQRIRNNKNNRCEEGALGCKKKERGDQKKNVNHRKCEIGDVGCKRKEGKEGKEGKERGKGDKCETGDCSPKKDVQPMNRRRCQLKEGDDQCKKRLQESRRRRRTRMREKTIVGGQDENVKMKKKLTSGKNKKKFVGDGEISKDLDSGRRLSEQLEVATNLNTPADVVTEATAAKRALELKNQEPNRNLSSKTIPTHDRVMSTVDIPPDSQRGTRDETPEDSGETVDLAAPSTPYFSATTPPPSGRFTKTEPEVTSSDTDSPTEDTVPTGVDYFYEDVDKK